MKLEEEEEDFELGFRIVEPWNFHSHVLSSTSSSAELVDFL